MSEQNIKFRGWQIC